MASTSPTPYRRAEAGDLSLLPDSPRKRFQDRPILSADRQRLLAVVSLRQSSRGRSTAPRKVQAL